MIHAIDVAWLGGLLEGEGSFMIGKGCAKIQMQSTDKDTVEKAAALLGTVVGGDGWKPKGKETYKKVWGCSVHGIRAIGWMMMLYQFLGERRQEKVREVLTTWTSSKRSPLPSKGMKIMSTCHPEKPRCVGMQCRACWMRDYRKRTGKYGSYYRKREATA